MPNCYAAVLKRKQFIIDTAAYKLEPKEKPYVAREKKVDTGHNWATCNGQAGTTDKFETVKMSLTALFGKHDMRVVECKEIFDKASRAGKNQYRVVFELIDGFNKQARPLQDQELDPHLGCRSQHQVPHGLPQTSPCHRRRNREG